MPQPGQPDFQMAYEKFPGAGLNIAKVGATRRKTGSCPMLELARLLKGSMVAHQSATAGHGPGAQLLTDHSSSIA